MDAFGSPASPLGKLHQTDLAEGDCHNDQILVPSYHSARQSAKSAAKMHGLSPKNHDNPEGAATKLLALATLATRLDYFRPAEPAVCSESIKVEGVLQCQEDPPQTFPNPCFPEVWMPWGSLSPAT